MNLDVKTIITIVTFAAMMGGFYYSTQLRLDHLEDNVAMIDRQVRQLKRQKAKNLKGKVKKSGKTDKKVR